MWIMTTLADTVTAAEQLPAGTSAKKHPAGTEVEWAIEKSAQSCCKVALFLIKFIKDVFASLVGD